MDEAEFRRIKRAFERSGGVIASSPEIDRHLADNTAVAAALNAKTILARTGQPPHRSAVFEELIHTWQFRTGRDESLTYDEMELEAKLKLLKYKKAYRIPDIEHEETLTQANELRRGLNGTR
jgi:hypothetical protein